MGVTAAIIGAVAAIGGTTYSAVTYENNRLEAKKKSDEQEVNQQKLQGELAQKQKDEQANTDATRTRTQLRQRQRLNAASAQGRPGTILTSPLGVQGSDQTTGKTLLGS